jgi:tRNA(Ile)-lysidine synthase
VLDHLKAAGIEYREDESNLDLRYDRNRIRHEVLPFLEKLNPAVEKTLARQAELFFEIDLHLTEQAREFLHRHSERGAHGIRIDRSPLMRQPPAIRRVVIREAAQNLTGDISGWGREAVDSVMELLERAGAGRRDLPGGAAALASRDALRMTIQPGDGCAAEDSADLSVPLPLVHGAEILLSGDAFRVSIDEMPVRSSALVIPDGRREAWFDVAGLNGVLHIRRLRPGDRLRPFGSPGSRKVSDILIDRRIPRESRKRLPVLVQDNGGKDLLLWIPGVLRSGEALLGEESRVVARIERFGEPVSIV